MGWIFLAEIEVFLADIGTENVFNIFTPSATYFLKNRTLSFQKYLLFQIHKNEVWIKKF